MNTEKVAIIILNYNGFPYILDCLKSLKEAIRDKEKSNKIVVVDNNSKDNSLKMIKKSYPKITIIKNKKNLGYAKGNNQGIKYALNKGFEYLLLLNPDTKVNKNFLLPLIQLIKSDNKIGIAGPLLTGREGPNNIYALGAKFNQILGRTKHIHIPSPSEKPLRVTSEVFLRFPTEQEMVSGCCMLVKKEVFEKIGLFDERFFMYYEDTDFSLRARKAGYKIYMEPKSFVYHYGGLSVGGLSLKKIIYIIRGNFIFDLKWVKPYYWPIAFSYLVVLGGKMFIDLLAMEVNKFTSEESDVTSDTVRGVLGEDD